MSDDIFVIEEIPVNRSIQTVPNETERHTRRPRTRNVIVNELISGEHKNNINDAGHETGQEKNADCRLHEIEQQLEMAEWRCNTLKGQVNYMRLLYNGMGNEAGDAQVEAQPQTSQKKPEQNSAFSKRKRYDKGVKHNTRPQKNISNKGDGEQWKEEPSRDFETQTVSVQNEQTYKAEMIAGAEKSIHNIISGITNSVNKLSQLQLQIERTSIDTNRNDKPTKNKNKETDTSQLNRSRTKDNIRNTTPEKPYQTNLTSNMKLPGNDENDKNNSNTSSNTSNKDNNNNIIRHSIIGENKIIGVTTTLNPESIIKHTISSIKAHGKIKNVKRSRSVTCKQEKSKTGSGISIAELKKRLKGTVIDKKMRLSPHIIPTESKFAKKLPGMKKSKLLSKNIDEVEKKTEMIPINEHKKSDKLIELYHNTQMATASEDSIAIHKKMGGQMNTIKKLKTIYPVNPKISEESQHETQSLQPVNEERPATQQDAQNNQIIPKCGCDGTLYYKNYELPTIASKMKQVAKNYFQNFTFRTIPFVAATSTTPSHNLGINIQQVLSIMKGRKPLTGISPTLAYNIELAANKLGSRPFSSIVSNFGSRLTTRCVCPAGRRVNFAQLQEQAKNIQDDVYDDGSLNPEVCKDGIKSAATWSMDPQKRKDQCICLPKTGVNFNDVCSKYMNYQQNQKPNYEMVKRIQVPSKKPWNYNSVPKKNNTEQQIRQLRAISQTLVKSRQTELTPRSQMIATRERNLKEVLKNLHEEFSKLNDRYEELKENVTSGNAKNPEGNFKELEQLEKDLLNKEDEITMVIALYKEVVALKQQIKVLKKRASQISVTVTPYTRFKDYRDQNAAGHLTKLLRHIQQFQESFKPK